MVSKLRMLATLLVVSVGATIAVGAATTLPEGPGVNLVYASCRTCHSLSYVKEAKGLLPAQWDSLIASMQDYGLEVSPGDKEKILAYLKTYLGPNPPPAKKSAQHASAAIDGGAVFQHSCAACHGKSGLGQPGYFPPLADNPDLFLSQTFPVLVVLNGIQGAIEVNDQGYNGTMPAFAHLSDTEIAAVVNYIRSAWGNEAHAAATTPITPEQVAKLRTKTLSAAAVLAIREQLHGAAQ